MAPVAFGGSRAPSSLPNAMLHASLCRGFALTLTLGLLACTPSPREFTEAPSAGSPSGGSAEAGSSPTNVGAGGQGGKAGNGESGGGTSGSGTSCEPGASEPCWETPDGVGLEGDPETLSGNCRAGARTCSSDGAWGACEGAVSPLASDDCTPGDDSNCNGKRNEGCSCTDGDERACGTDQGNCAKGVQKCAGSSWGECEGQVVAEVKDTCESLDDANCNGVPNEGCDCLNGASRACGIAAGNCTQGMQTCALGVWQACQGNVEPSGNDKCTAGDDSDCDGVANEGCPCIEGTQEACGSSVGNCRKGTRKCVNGAWGACSGNISPKGADSCDAGDDSTCNGTPNEGCTCINDATKPCGSSVGNCRQGTQDCVDGVWASSCVGEVKAAAKDLCSDGDDSNCNGQPNEGCSCLVNETQGCGKCGSQTCSASGWGTCSNEGACSPGQVEEQSELCPGGCTSHKRKRTCTNSCSWGAWGGWDTVCKYESQSSKTCSSGDVYWQDSCGTRGILIQDCHTASCNDGACFRDCSGPLTFDDPQFESVVRGYIDHDASPLYAADVAETPSLMFSNSNSITSIGGIECLGGLEILDIGYNYVHDLAPIRGAGPNLWTVFVSNNNVTDLSPLADNPHITNIDVTGNPFNCNTQISYISQVLNRPDGNAFHDCQ